MIPSTEIVDRSIDLLRFYDVELIYDLNVLKILTKYRELDDNFRKCLLIYVCAAECREAMCRRNMLTKLPATIKYANLSEARVVVDLLGQCAQYSESHFDLLARTPSDFCLKVNSGLRSRFPILNPASDRVSPS